MNNNKNQAPQNINQNIGSINIFPEPFVQPFQNTACHHYQGFYPVTHNQANGSEPFIYPVINR